MALESSSKPGRLSVAQLDISQRSSLDRLQGSFDAVINLAAYAGVRASVDDPWTYLRTNTEGTLNLLEFCRSRAIPKFVLASTSSLYGKNNSLPYREGDNTDGLLSPYAASKKAAEVLCHCYHNLHGINVAVLRYFTVYGPAGRPDMAPFRFIQRIYEGRGIVVNGDGSQKRDFTYVDDIARGTAAALRVTGFEIINLGCNRPVTILELIRVIERTTGRTAVMEWAPTHPADVPATWADVSRAKTLLGWAPRAQLAEGIEASVGWYEKNRDWAKDIDADSGRGTRTMAAVGSGYSSSFPSGRIS